MRTGAQGIENWIAAIDSSKLLLLENLNHTGIVALRVLAVYDATKAFAVLGKDIPAFDCKRADNFDKFPGFSCVKDRADARKVFRFGVRV